MHLAHCLKASVTSPEWPFFPPNSGIWILLENPSFFFLLPPLEVVDLAEWELSKLSPLLLPLLPRLLPPFLKRRGLPDLHLKLHHRQRSEDRDPVQVKVPYRLRRWLSDGMERSRPWAHPSLIYADHWPSQPT